MSSELVVSNSSPLIALRQIGRLELLRDLFGQVLILAGGEDKPVDPVRIRRD